MAFGLAVYASPGGLPSPDARLASSRWSDATGRASTRRVPTKGFRGVIVTSLPPSPSFAWRKHIDRGGKTRGRQPLDVSSWGWQHLQAARPPRGGHLGAGRPAEKRSTKTKPSGSRR